MGFTSSALSAASSVDPEPISGAALQIGSIIGSIFGASHAKAVAAEAGDLNKAVPQYRNNLIAIANAFNSGQIGVSAALQAIDASTDEYYGAVSSLIKDSSNHGAACTSADANGKGSNCNGPCTVGCAWIIPWAERMKAAIQTGSATLTFTGIPSHAGFSGLPSFSIQIQHSPETQLTSNGSLHVAGPGVPTFVNSGGALSYAQGVGTPASSVSSIAGIKLTPGVLIGFGALALLALFVVANEN